MSVLEWAAAQQRGGSGFARQAARLRRVLLEAVSEDDVAAVAGKLVELAREGDLAAIRLLLLYTPGKPGEWPRAEAEQERPTPPAPTPGPAPAAKAAQPVPAAAQSSAQPPPRAAGGQKPAGAAAPARAPEGRPDLLQRIQQAVGKPGETAGLCLVQGR